MSSVTAEVSSCSGTAGEVHVQESLRKKPKVLWPAANEKGKYKYLEENVCKKLYNMRRTAEVKLKKLASSIYMTGKELFGNANGKNKKEKRTTYSDPKRNEPLTPVDGLKYPTNPGVGFQVGNFKKKEVDDFVRKASVKRAPGDDGVSYKVYKYCDRLSTTYSCYSVNGGDKVR